MKKGLIQVMNANIICLLIGVLTNFILPKHLSLDTYALIKTYALYISYAGFFSLGYNDGMYLKYGGKNLNDVLDMDLAINFKNYIIIELMAASIILCYGLYQSDPLITLFAIGMIITNVIGYFKSFCQAIGDFKTYGKSLNFEKIILFLCNIFLIFIIQSDYAWNYILIQILIGFLVMIYLGYYLNKKINFINKGKFDFNEIKFNINTGFILMLGNFSSGLFTGIDRWFVRILMSSTSFALYAFAVSMEQMINVFITPITVSMYNYFCKINDFKKIIEIKKIVLIWGLMIISLAFPAKWVLENYLTNYIKASSVIFLLFGAQAFYVVIKGIYVNLYKSNKQQKKYFYQMILMLVIAFILNILLYSLFKSMIAIAAGTFITSIVWLFVCELGSREIRFSYREYIAICIIMITYLICGYFFNSYMGLVIYLLLVMITLLIFMRDSLVLVFNFILRFLYSRKIKVNPNL